LLCTKRFFFILTPYTYSRSYSNSSPGLVLGGQVNPGESAVVDPDGKFLVEPVRHREEILYAEVDTWKMKGPRYQFDVAGHYGRPDIFELTVNRKKHEMIRVLDISTEEESHHAEGQEGE
jgi:nitrilase